MSWTKLIHSAVLPDLLDHGMTLVEDPVRFQKRAAAAGGAGTFDYSALIPDANHVGIHMVALGEFERYGQNRNADSFPKAACINFHDTFVKHGNLHRHHKNKPEDEKLGKIAASIYNPGMGRIELFVHANKDKAAAELQKLASDGEVPVSMACVVKYDRCNACNTTRSSSRDPNQCEHIRDYMGKVAEDGTVYCVHNDEPKFFDISFVIKPADRIAWTLKTAGVDITKISSAALAEMESIYTPVELAADSHASFSKYGCAVKLAAMEKLYVKLEAQGPASGYEDYLWQLRKAAACQTLTDSAIAGLRSLDVGDVLYSLAEKKIVLDPVSYCKYAMGLDLGTLASHMPEIKQACALATSRMLSQGSILEACNDSFYDVVDFFKGGSGRMKAAAVLGEEERNASINLDYARERIISATIDGAQVKMASAEKMEKMEYSPLAKCVAQKYVAYKLAAADAMQALDKNVNEQHYALMAARSMANA